MLLTFHSEKYVWESNSFSQRLCVLKEIGTKFALLLNKSRNSAIPNKDMNNRKLLNSYDLISLYCLGTGLTQCAMNCATTNRTAFEKHKYLRETVFVVR